VIVAQSIDDRLLSYLADLHSIERQALIQMQLAPRMVGDGMADDFRHHRVETEGHLRLVKERLDAHGADPSRPKDAAGWLGGVGMALFARVQPDTPGKLAFHAHSYEHMELAAYRLLERVAEVAGDEETVAAARRIGAEEEAMAERIAGRFDQAVDDSLRGLADSDAAAHLDTYLADMHALETQSTRFLEAARSRAGAPALEAVFEGHLEETLEQRRRLAERIAARLAGLGHGARARRRQPGRLLRRTARPAAEAGGLRLRLRAARGRGLRAARPGRRPGRRRGHGRAGRGGAA
jgi:ferritin-like metal-binding protein YciE